MSDKPYVYMIRYHDDNMVQVIQLFKNYEDANAEQANLHKQFQSSHITARIIFLTKEWIY